MLAVSSGVDVLAMIGSKSPLLKACQPRRLRKSIDVGNPRRGRSWDSIAKWL